MNADWHRAHVLGRGASLDERVTWHLEHARVCACRVTPAEIVAEIRARGLDIATEGRDGAKA
jgi:lambda repressor-like predicted transcriptional regulator